MEWDGIPVRRSLRLVHEPPTLAPPTPPSPPSDHEIPTLLHDLRDLGPGVEIIPLPDTNMEFNLDYLTSQEEPNRQQSSGGEFMNMDDESDGENGTGGGLEEILWPPEMLMQARSYGKRRAKRQDVIERSRFNEAYYESGAGTSRDAERGRPDLYAACVWGGGLEMPSLALETRQRGSQTRATARLPACATTGQRGLRTGLSEGQQGFPTAGRSLPTGSHGHKTGCFAGTRPTRPGQQAWAAHHRAGTGAWRPGINPKVVPRRCKLQRLLWTGR